MNLKDAFDSIEKVFRYIVPGVIFVVLFFLAFPSKIVEARALAKDTNLELLALVLIPSLGMVIYALHRLLLWTIIEPILYLHNQTAASNYKDNRDPGKFVLCQYPRNLASFFKARHKEEAKEDKNTKRLSDYLYYRWAMLHSVAIFAELLLLFTCFSEKGALLAMKEYRSKALWVGTIVFVLALLNLWYMYVVEKHLFGHETNQQDS